MTHNINSSGARSVFQENTLQTIKNSSLEVIESALLAIKKTEQSSSTPLISNYNLTIEQRGSISHLVSSVFKEDTPLLNQALLSGYENSKDYVIAELTQALWNLVDVVPDKDDSGLIFLLPSSTSSQSALDVNAIFDSMENRLEEVTDVEKAKSNHWVVSEQEIESWPDVVAKWKENCQILRSQVLGNIPRDLFSENPETRKGQYSVFLNKTYDSLRILSSRNEDYDFYDQNVPYLLNNCFTAWESAIDTLHQRADLEIKGSVFSKAHQVARNLREHILIIHILPSAIRNFDPEVSQEIIDNVHYKRLAKQWGNQRLRLGFSDEQLGEKESMFDMISSHLDFVTPDIMKKYYTTAAISDELNQLYDKQSEMNKNLIWDLILDSYKKGLKERGVPYIDYMKSLCGLYQDLEATQKIESFEEYSRTLKTISRRFLEEGFFPPFDVKTPYESIYSNLCSTELQHALLKKGDLHLELERLLSIGRIDLPRKKELESLIEELELSKSADVKTQYLMKQKSRITGVITHLEEEIISKNASLLRKMAETSSGKLTPFGLALIGVFTKVMTVETDVLGINNHVSKHILDWFCQLPVPVECFEGLTERLGREPSLYPVLPESLRKLPDIVSLAHTVPGLVYGVTPEKYQACMEDPISAFSRGDLVEVFENDINIVLPAILRYPPALRFAKNKEIVLEILRRDSNFFPYICEQFKNDMDIIRLIARKNPYFLQSIHRKEVILKILQENGMYLRYINSKLANDSDVIWASFIQNKSSLMFVSRLDVIKEIVEKESSALSYVTNKKIVLNIVRQNGMLLSCVKSMFKSDKEVVLAAIENNPEALQFVLSHDVLVDVVKKNFKLFAFCSIFFKKNLNFVWDIVQIHPFLFSLITDKYVVLQIVEKNWKLLKFVSESFKSDIDVIKTAVLKNGVALENISNKNIILTLIAQNGLLLKHVKEGFKNDKDIILAAITQNKRAWQFISPALRQDPDIIRVMQSI